MAKELILLPKLKYDRLVDKADQNSEQLRPTDIQDSSDSLTENQPNKEEKNNFLQSGWGYVSKKQIIGRPPGNPDVRQKKKKNITWMTY